MFEVTIEETFSAGHALRNYRGKCENVHGHNYRCQVMVEGDQLDDIGLLVDFVELKRVVHSVLDRLRASPVSQPDVPREPVSCQWCAVQPARGAHRLRPLYRELPQRGAGLPGDCLD